MNLFNPGSKSRRSPSQRVRRNRAFQPNLTAMDRRLALTGVTAAVVSSSTIADEPLRIVAVVPIVNPYANTPLVTDPDLSPAFSVQLNRPIEKDSLGFNSFKIYKISPDGSASGFDESEIQYLEEGNGSGSPGNSLLLSFITPLQLGQYELVLKNNNSLRGLDGEASVPGNQLVEVFAVGADAARLTSTRLMTQIIQESTTTLLPVVASDLNASLNQLDLPEGTNWVITPDFGGANPDDYRIALFDAQKQLILTAPGSKMLDFDEGLRTGRYFLQIYQITGMKDDLAPTIRVTVSGSMPATAASGSADSVTNRVQPINQNGSDTNADALLLNLNGIALSPAFFDHLKTAFVLTDQAGTAQAVSPSNYDPTSNQLVLLLPNYLATGRYTLSVNLPATGAASTPSVLKLGSFDNVLRNLPPDQLGTIFASQVDQNWRNPTDVLPGQSISQQFAAIEEHQFQIDLSDPNFTGQLFQVTKDSSGQTQQTLVGDISTKTFFLEPGVYQIVVRNNATTPRQVAFSIMVIDVSHDSLSVSGVGQSPASLSRATLVGNGSSTIGTQNVATNRAYTGVVAGPIALSRLAEESDQAGSQAHATREQPSISFNSSALIQSPLGTLSGSISVNSVAPIASPTTGLSASVASAMNSAIFLNPALPGSSAEIEGQSRQPRANSSTLPVPESDPGLEAPLARFAIKASGPMSAEFPPIREHAEFNEQKVASAEAQEAESATTDPAPTSANWLPTLNNLDLVMAAESDGLESPTNLADLTSPISILVATCVLAHRLKATRIGANLPDRGLIRQLWRRELSWLRGNHLFKVSP